jgi:hypothetical protein
LSVSKRNTRGGSLSRRRVPAVRSSVLTVHCCQAGSKAQCASASVRLSKPVHWEKAHGVSGGGAAGGATSQWQTTPAAPAAPSIPPLTHTCSAYPGMLVQWTLVAMRLEGNGTGRASGCA